MRILPISPKAWQVHTVRPAGEIFLVRLVRRVIYLILLIASKPRKLARFCCRKPNNQPRASLVVLIKLKDKSHSADPRDRLIATTTPSSSTTTPATAVGKASADILPLTNENPRYYSSRTRTSSTNTLASKRSRNGDTRLTPGTP